VQLKKNPRDTQYPEGDEAIEDSSTRDPSLGSSFAGAGDELPRPAWRRESAQPSALPPRLETPERAPAPEAGVTTRSESVVDAHSSFDGHYETEQDLRIHGTVGGEVVCRGQLTIERDATAKARIQARDALVRGRLEGEVTCSGKLVLEATAVVSGTIRAAVLVVQEGASLTGNVETSAVASAPPTQAARIPRREVPEARADQEAQAAEVPGRASRRDLPSFALVSSDERGATDRNPAVTR